MRRQQLAPAPGPRTEGQRAIGAPSSRTPLSHFGNNPGIGSSKLGRCAVLLFQAPREVGPNEISWSAVREGAEVGRISKNRRTRRPARRAH